MYQSAHAWEDSDEQMRVAADRIRGEVTIRYGIDSSSLDRAARLHSEAAQERAQARQDVAAATAIGTDVGADENARSGADAHYEAATQRREDALWDTASRREDLAASLEGVASAEAVDVRMIVDVGQSKPAHKAAVRRPQKITKGVQARTAGKGITAQPGRRSHP